MKTCNPNTPPARRGGILPALIAAFLAYLFSFGATWAGVFNPERVPLTLALFFIVFGGWLAVRTLNDWRWPITPLDPAIPIWGAAVLVGAALHPDHFPRLIFGLWFVTLYGLTWYALSDALANGLPHVTLANALLVAAFPVMLSALGEVGQHERVSGVLQNPNILGGFLVLTVPMAVGRLLACPHKAYRGMWWAVWGLYILLGGVALLFSGSRGAWIGTGAAVAFIGWALFFQHVHVGRAALIGAVAIVAAGAVLIALRGDAGRLDIYEAAVAAFLRRPLAGEGLFSFKFWEPIGGNLFRLHIHVHNLPLHIAAELGLIGLAAFALSVYRLGVTGWQHWKAAPPGQKPILKGALAGLVGFAAHHMVDVPAMTPAVALTLIVVLAVACTPITLPTAKGGRYTRPVLALGVLVVLLVIGFAANAYTPTALMAAVNFGKP